MFSKLRLRHRILIGYLILVLIGFGAAMWTSFNLSADMGNVQNEYHIDVLQQELIEAALLSETAFRGYIITGREDLLTELSQARRLFSQAATSLRERLTDRTRLHQITEISDLIEGDLDAARNRLIELRRQNTPESLRLAAQAIDKGDESETMHEAEAAVTAMRNSAQDRVQAAEERAQNSRTQVLWSVLLAPIISTIVSVLAAMLISSRVSNSIEAAVVDVTEASSNIAEIVERQEQLARRQAEAVQKAAATMEEMDRSSRESAEQAEAVAASAGRILDLAQDGAQTVKLTSNGMSSLKEKVGILSQQIKHLGRHTAQIGTITHFVGDVANQTNMLALNAAVEAARAGEHSKGFSVVAAEIRKLADQSKRSAERIDRLLADLVEAIDNAVKSTEEGTRTLEQGTDLVASTAQTFHEVTTSIGTGFEKTRQISLNAVHQAASISEISEAMEAINNSAQESSLGLTQTISRVVTLQNAAKNLQSIV